MDIEQGESAKVWYLEVEGQTKGPYSERQVQNGINTGKVKPDMLLFGPGMGKWEPISWSSHFSFGGDTPSPQQPKHIPRPTYHKSMMVHDIDFQIYGDDMQFVEIELDPGEAAIAEAGSMMCMHNDIDMETIFGDETESGVVGKLLGAGKRLITGESLFITAFTNEGSQKRHVSFAAPYPGKILPLNLAEFGGEIICQKDAFLCAAKGVSIDIVFQKKIGAGLFGGEGFIMQRLIGDGLTFVHAGGTLHNIELKAGEKIKVDSGCLVAMESQVNYDIAFVGGVTSALFGGEGLFFATLTGPGNVWIQSMPFSRLAGKIHSVMPKTVGGGQSVGEGSLLGEIVDIVTSR